MSLFRRRSAQPATQSDIKGTPPDPTAESRIAHLKRVQHVAAAVMYDLHQVEQREAEENAARYPGTFEDWLTASQDVQVILGSIVEESEEMIDELRKGIPHPSDRTITFGVPISTDLEPLRRTLSILRGVIDGIAVKADDLARTTAQMAQTSGDVGQWRGAVATFLTIAEGRFERLAAESDQA